MPTIQLTNNTSLTITGSSADNGATLNRYLTHPLTFLTPAGFEAIAATPVGTLHPEVFPLTASANGQAQFAVAGTSLTVQLGAAASISALTGDNAAAYRSSLKWAPDPAAPALLSFAIEGLLTTSDSATVSDFSFGISKNAAVTVTSTVAAPATESLASALKRAVSHLTIPHDVADLQHLAPNTTCQIDAVGSLKFSASVTYTFLNNPLATLSLTNLPALSLNASAGATLAATATHTAEHSITLVKLPNGLLHLAVELTDTDDLASSLTVSASLSAKAGSLDAVAFLVGKISPSSQTEVKKLQAGMPPDKYSELNGGIKSAIDAAVSSSLQASLRLALDRNVAKDRLFLFEVDLAALNADSTQALQSALAGDFTLLTRPGNALAGIRELDHVLTVASTVQHSLTLHLLGIFNYNSTDKFVQKSIVGFTKDTHEIVLSDETIRVVNNNLDAERLREVVVKCVTLTLPASANTPMAAAPLKLLFFDREGSASPSTMRQFANVLQAIGAPQAAAAQSLLQQHLKHYGTCSLYLNMNLNPEQCRQLFAGSNVDWTDYLGYARRAQATILANDEQSAERRKLFTADLGFWRKLEEAGAAPNRIRLLKEAGIPQEALVDVVSLVWWSMAMQDYAAALASGKSLVGVGKEMVHDSTGGFNEPWLVLAIWMILNKPALQSTFTSSLLP